MKRAFSFLLTAGLGLCMLGGCPVEYGHPTRAAEGLPSADGSDLFALLYPAGDAAEGLPSTDGSAATGGGLEPTGGFFVVPGLLPPIGPPSDDVDRACAEPSDAEQWRAELLRLVNEQRVAQGLEPAGRSALLERLAAEHACAMIRHDFRGHDDPVTGQSGDQRLLEWMQQYGYRTMGEIVARGQQTPAEVVDMWMNSPTHHAVILNALYTEAGAGVQTGGAYGLHAVMQFGRPRDLTAEGD